MILAIDVLRHIQYLLSQESGKEDSKDSKAIFRSTSYSAGTNELELTTWEGQKFVIKAEWVNGTKIGALFLPTARPRPERGNGQGQPAEPQ